MGGSRSRKIIGIHSSPDYLLHLYKSVVCPHLKYCSVIWDPDVIYLKNRLMDIEKFALRMCFKQWHTPYSDLILLANIIPLDFRRLCAKLHLVYKFIYKMSFIPDSILVPSSNRKSNRLNHSLTLLPYSCSHNYLLHSTIPHMIYLWNNLPLDPATCNSFNHFKILLDSFFKP